MNAKAWHWALALAAILTLFTLGVATNRGNGEICYVGVPDGAAGLMVRYVLKGKMGQHAIHTVRFAPYTLYDCCAGSTQYALGAGRLDMAIMCPDAAKALVTRDRRYEIAGPVIKNSDIFITRRGHVSHEPAIAVSQKRDFQRQMVARRFGEGSRPVPMFHAAVPFAYSKGAIQGAVVDITKAFNLEGVLSSATDSGDDIITYVMVIKKSLKDSHTFQNFMDMYDQAVRETDNPERLLYLLRTCESADYTMREVEIWKKLNVRFMHPLSCRPQG